MNYMPLLSNIYESLWHLIHPTVSSSPFCGWCCSLERRRWSHKPPINTQHHVVFESGVLEWTNRHRSVYLLKMSQIGCFMVKMTRISLSMLQETKRIYVFCFTKTTADFSCKKNFALSLRLAPQWALGKLNRCCWKTSVLAPRRRER